MAFSPTAVCQRSKQRGRDRSMARTPCSAKVLSHTGCRGQYGQDTPSPHGLDSVARVLPRWCSSALLVRQESVNPLLLGSMPRAIDASASGAGGSSPAGPLLDIYVDADTACPSRISLLSPQRRCLSRPVFASFFLGAPSFEILSHPLSLAQRHSLSEFVCCFEYSRPRAGARV